MDRDAIITLAVEREFPCDCGQLADGVFGHGRFCSSVGKDRATRACQAVAERWIPVTERLPVDHHRVLFSGVDEDGDRWVELGSVSVGDHTYVTYETHISDREAVGVDLTATHWQPLPPAPGKEQA